MRRERFFFEKGYKLVALEHWSCRWLVVLCGFTEALLWLVEVQSIEWLKVGHPTYKTECIGWGFLQCEKLKLQRQAEELSLLLHLYIFQVVFQCLREWENEHERVMICTRRWLRVVLSSLERSRCTVLLCILKLGSWIVGYLPCCRIVSSIHLMLADDVWTACRRKLCVIEELCGWQLESKCALVYGQMNEPPGARARVGLTGLTVAEHFRDAEGQDVLFFIDNIFRFTQVSLLGNIQS